jgi:ribulose-phosphate 3-epimerase
MGPDMCRWLRRALPDAFLDIHLMVDNPGLFIAPFAKAGASNITFHIEVADLPAAKKLAADAHNRGCTAGLAINPPTPGEQVLPYLPDFDVILVMSVNPGFSGQSFIESSLDKTRLIKPRLRRDQRLEMDGGIGPDNITAVRKAGCDVVVAASAIFGVPPPARAQVIGTLRAR